MTQNHIVIIVGLAILNGIFSPALIIVFALQGIWYPMLLPPMLPLVFALSSLILSTLTLMIGGVPAALYERLAGGGQSTFASGLVWLGGVLLLTLPAIPNMLKALGLGS
ncbi:hypothetical protein [Aestuariivirga sp.]|uniref:hypothetical protein n=1 Tax=Aestuariivirga sp. TaxID=2650926 RepID=UPI00359466D8